MPTVTQMKLRCTAKNSVRSAWFGCSVPSNGFKFIALGQMKSADMVNLAGVIRHAPLHAGNALSSGEIKSI